MAAGSDDKPKRTSRKPPGHSHVGFYLEDSLYKKLEELASEDDREVNDYARVQFKKFVASADRPRKEVQAVDGAGRVPVTGHTK